MEARSDGVGVGAEAEEEISGGDGLGVGGVERVGELGQGLGHETIGCESESERRRGSLQ